MWKALLLLLVPGAVTAQDTDLWLFDRSDGYRLVEQVTDRDGYDSQPSFTADSRALLFSSDRAGATTDVFRWDLEDGTVVNLTRTPDENEFSPQPWGEDRFTFVLQEGVPYQNLWVRPYAGGERQRVLKSYVPVGYYTRNGTGVLFWGRIRIPCPASR
jgi:Tol biopolymer transport system component